MRLITAKDHPLVRRRTVRPRDLRPYPLVNAPDEFYTAYLRAVLDESHAYHGTEPIVQADLAASIRRFVGLGLGIGLVPAPSSMPFHPEVHERSMSRYFGSIVVHLIRRRGAFTPEAGEEFIQTVRRELGPNARSSR